MIVGLDIENKTMKCSLCDEKIKSKYNRYDQHKKIYCDSCFTRFNRCFVCKLPSSKTVLLESVRICMDCYSKKHYCTGCGNNLSSGTLNTVPGIQGFFCKSCIGSKYKCSRCGFPSNNESNKLLLIENSFYLCGSCQSWSVLTEEIAENILMNIAHILSKKMDLAIIEGLSIKLASKNDIRCGIDKVNGSIDARIKRKHELYPSFSSRNGSEYTIYILRGLTVSSFIAVLTYEYVMLWQREYSIYQISRMLWEGIAEWIVTKVMMLLGYHKEISRIEGSLDEFAIGLKKIQVIEKSKGIKGVVNLISQSK